MLLCWMRTLAQSEEEEDLRSSSLLDEKDFEMEKLNSPVRATELSCIFT